MIALICLIVGVVGLVIPEHFKGQHPAAISLLAISVLLIVAQSVLFSFAASKVKRHHNSFRSRQLSRNRRGF